jgi:hypothetical protein
MAIKNKLNTLLIFLLFFIAVALTSSCSPIGSLLVDSGTVAAALDYIRAEPLFSLYAKGDSFKPTNDVKVFGIFGGVEEPIPIEQIEEIKIIKDPGLISEDIEFIFNDNVEEYPLLKEGVKNVVISYSGMEARYPIVVGEKGVTTWNPPDGSGSGITIIWK